MIRYAQFFHRHGEAVGGDSIAYLSRRHSIPTSAAIARSLCRARDYAGFELREGDNLAQAKVIHGKETVAKYGSLTR